MHGNHSVYSTLPVAEGELSRRTGQRFQAVVISLKDAFFHHADALVGVAKDPGVAASTTYTFDLSRFIYQEA